MRVTKRLPSEERGAVMMIVAISLLVLVGVLVLTVDLGRMVAVKREMVRTADAAALAAAQECAFGHGSGDASSAASHITDTNTHDLASGATTLAPLIFVPSGECDHPTSSGAKLVTVKVTTSLNMFFAPIFGIDDGSVVAQATATWATPGTVPISVNVVPLKNCEDAVAAGTQDHCLIDYPKATLQEPRWGILDLANWNMTQGQCPLSASYVNNIITSGGIWPLPTPTPPVYDCIDNGAQFSSWMLLEGQTFLFPVIDVQKSLLANGHLVKDDPGCTTGPQCRVANAYVIDFVKLKVLSVTNQGSTIVLDVELVPSHGSITGIEIRLVN